MLRELTLLILLIDSALLVFSGWGKYAVCLLIVGVILYRKNQSHSHSLEKEFNYIAAGLFRLYMFILGACILVALFSALELKDMALQFVALSLSITPLLALLSLRDKIAVSSSRLGQFRTIRFLRSVLAIKTGLFLIVVAGLVTLLQIHLLPALGFMQILAIELALLAPVYALQYDNNRLKMLNTTDRNLRVHTLSRKAFKSYFGFGLIAALLTCANYLFLFIRHDLSPFYLDPTLPLYQQATTLATATFVLCMLLGIMFERVDKHEFFINEHTLDNIKLTKAFGVALLVLALISYSPKINSIFQAQPLDIYDWLTAFAAAALYALVRMTKRHTRKHTRHSILKLYKEHGLKI